LVLTGDHHQFGPVGPGGALGALVARHPGAVHYLNQNRRQHDPEERRALEALRDGDVAELNRRARAWMEASGRLSGPELACPGGATYRAGDRVVTLAPGAAGTLVTSERATVETVEPTAVRSSFAPTTGDESASLVKKLGPTASAWDMPPPSTEARVPPPPGLIFSPTAGDANWPTWP
jgi:hypothetical protein